MENFRRCEAELSWLVVVPDKNVHSEVEQSVRSSRHHHLAVAGVQRHWSAALLTRVAIYSVNHSSSSFREDKETEKIPSNYNTSSRNTPQALS